MKNYHSAPIWQSKNPYFKRLAPRSLQHWLSNRDSLTHALINACPDEFSVKVLKECWQKPTLSESTALAIKPGSMAFVRQVHLYCGSQPWVYARTVIPQNTLLGELQKLTHLGTQPLGAILFANKHIQRGAIDIARISGNHKMHQAALMFSQTLPSEIWGRRSLFRIKGNPLLVNEIFLSDMTHKKSCK